MQTFITSFDMKRNFQILDRQRLGKQRVEAIQIAWEILGKCTGWRNHPAINMWRGYAPYLIRVYIFNCMKEWKDRGYKNDKCEKHFQKLIEKVKDLPIRTPPWITLGFCKSHQSNLLRKNPNYYRRFFPNIPNNLSYVWPV